jgi:hypothetical protein
MKIGDVVIPIRNSNSHNYTNGRKYRILRISNPGPPMEFVAQDIDNYFIGNNLRETDCKLSKKTKRDIEKKLGEMELELEKFNRMLEYIEETGSDTLLSNEFISWHILKIINSDDKDKFKKLSKILNTISNKISVDLIKHV